MPVPKRKVSKARRDQRAANKGIKPAVVVACQTCQAPVLPHIACKECGHYKGSKVFRTKTERMYKRAQERQKIQEKAAAAQSQNQSQDQSQEIENLKSNSEKE